MSEKPETAQANLTALAENPYPGRGIIMGLNTLGDTAIQAYWVMGRSENSRNRILVEEDDVVRTEAHDPDKVEDPSLIIYNAMRVMDRRWHVVSNGHQTDAIIDDGWQKHKSFEETLEFWAYEPDEPNYTPRISGVLDAYFERAPGAGGFALYDLSVIRKDAESDESIHSLYHGSLALNTDNGAGKCVHTYLGDGSPLPSFDREPYAVPVGEGVDDTAEMYWAHLDKDNRVAIVVKGIHLATGKIDYQVINAHEEAA